MKKTKIKILGLLLVLSMMLCSCNKEEEKNTREYVGQKITAEATTEATTTEAPTTEAPTTEAPTTEATIDTSYFFNDTNYQPLEEKGITIKPRYVYWDGDVLVAECFVINSCDTAVYDISVERLAFSDDGTNFFADAYFGTMEGATIPANSHIIWTFKFSNEVLTYYAKDLSTLRTVFDTKWKY